MPHTKSRLILSRFPGATTVLPAHDVLVLTEKEANAPPERSPLLQQIRASHEMRFCEGGYCALFPRNGPPPAEGE